MSDYRNYLKKLLRDSTAPSLKVIGARKGRTKHTEKGTANLSTQMESTINYLALLSMLLLILLTGLTVIGFTILADML